MANRTQAVVWGLWIIAGCVQPGSAAGKPGEIEATEAMAAYREAIRAYNSGDPATYFGTYTETLACFHGAPNFSLAQLRSAREPVMNGSAGVFIAELQPIYATENHVVLVDRGIWWRSPPQGSPSDHAYLRRSAEPIEQGVGETVVALRKVGGRWRINAETDRDHLECLGLGPLALGDMATPLANCGEKNEECLTECDHFCSGDAPGNGCNVCPEACATALRECVGADSAVVAVEDAARVSYSPLPAGFQALGGPCDPAATADQPATLAMPGTILCSPTGTVVGVYQMADALHDPPSTSTVLSEPKTAEYWSTTSYVALEHNRLLVHKVTCGECRRVMGLSFVGDVTAMTDGQRISVQTYLVGLPDTVPPLRSAEAWRAQAIPLVQPTR